MDESTPAAQRGGSDDADVTRPSRSERRAGGRGSIDATSFAERLNRLFDTIRPPARGPLRDAEVLRMLADRGHAMSAAYLSQLRSGYRSNPQPNTLRMLADVFGVRTEYLTGEDAAYTRRLHADMSWLDLAHDPDVRRVTSALLALPPDVREDVLQSAESRYDPAG